MTGPAESESEDVSNYAEAPHVTLDNDDPSLRDDSVRAFLHAENAKSTTLFAQIAETDDEREQMQRYSDSMLVVYRAGYLAAKAMLEARSLQVAALRELNDKAQRSLANARNDLAASRSELQRQRAATIKPEDAAPSSVNHQSRPQIEACRARRRRKNRTHYRRGRRAIDVGARIAACLPVRVR